MRALLFALGLVCWPVASGPVLRAAPGHRAGGEPLALTNALQILNLTAAQAAQSLPVKLLGVVIDESQPREQALILGDASASVYVSAATNLFAAFHRKDLLEITGVTSPGEFAPCVMARHARKLGSSDVPPALPVTYQQLITGSLDAQFVELTGVVRQCWPALTNDETWRIVLAANGGTVSVRIPMPQDPRIQEDAEVTIQAVCLYQFNQKRQALSPVLQVPRGGSVRINKLSPADPYAAPVHSSVSLLQYSRELPFGHRIHVKGVVTRAQPGSQVWIRDASSGLRIQIRQTDDLQPGDEIEAVGFPSCGASTPLLEDAIYQKIQTLPPPVPLVISNASEAYNYQDDLVCMTGLLTDIQPVLDGLVLTLEQGNTVFKAILKLPFFPNRQPAWQCGSRVRVAGICVVTHDEARPVMGIWHPQSFQILLRTPADLTVIRTPSWWTAAHAIVLLGILAGGLLLVCGVVMFVARQRLYEQAHRRAMAEAEFKAILTERNRLAREIHDTLAQGLAATSVQLQLVKIHAGSTSHLASHHIDQAQQMVRDSLEEARNTIWNMRPQVLETGDLVQALKQVLKQLSSGGSAASCFEVQGRERRLSASIENNVLRLGQEAIANAVNHAQASQITVILEFAEKQFVLTVEDDGSGFDPENPPPSEGGFGLVGMRERASELNGKLLIQSAPAQGTLITLFVPLVRE